MQALCKTAAQTHCGGHATLGVEAGEARHGWGHSRWYYGYFEQLQVVDCSEAAQANLPQGRELQKVPQS